MQGIEKYGGLWLDRSDGELVFEKHVEGRDVILVVWRMRDSRYRASIFDKAEDYRWTVPMWSERRPESWFESEEEARAYLTQRLETDDLNDKR